MNFPKRPQSPQHVIARDVMVWIIGARAPAHHEKVSRIGRNGNRRELAAASGRTYIQIGQGEKSNSRYCEANGCGKSKPRNDGVPFHVPFERECSVQRKGSIESLVAELHKFWTDKVRDKVRDKVLG